MDIRRKILEINQTDIFLNITDTAGLERFRSLTKMYYKGTDAILVGFDLTDPHTLEQIKIFWIDQVEKNASKEFPINIVLFGNKCDDKNNIKVKEEDIKKVQEKYNQYNIKYFETSSKDGTNVKELFEYATKMALKSRGLLPKVGLPEDTPLEKINIVEKINQKIEFKKIPKKSKKQIGLLKENNNNNEINNTEKENGEIGEFKKLNKYYNF